jgi:hypothetical protein
MDAGRTVEPGPKVIGRLICEGGKSEFAPALEAVYFTAHPTTKSAIVFTDIEFVFFTATGAGKDIGNGIFFILDAGILDDLSKCVWVQAHRQSYSLARGPVKGT